MIRSAWSLKLPWSSAVTATSPAAVPIVRLLGEPRRQPSSAAEQCALMILARDGSQPLHDLIDRVARGLYRCELGRAGWTIDIGWLGAGAFRDDAGRAVEDGAGELWTIDSEAR